jgi:hypothetical protein
MSTHIGYNGNRTMQLSVDNAQVSLHKTEGTQIHGIPLALQRLTEIRANYFPAQKTVVFIIVHKRKNK